MMQSALADSPEVLFVTEVQYLDYQKDQFKQRSQGSPTPNAFFPILNKRKSFEHEREVRITWWNMMTANKPYTNDAVIEYGKAMAVDLTKLLLWVMVSPVAGAWFVDIVSAALRVYPGSPSSLISCH